MGRAFPATLAEAMGGAPLKSTIEGGGLAGALISVEISVTCSELLNSDSVSFFSWGSSGGLGISLLFFLLHPWEMKFEVLPD